MGPKSILQLLFSNVVFETEPFDLETGQQKFETGLNIIIAIVQKVSEWPSCPFAKMISLGVHPFGKTTVLSPYYFLNYGYYDI